MSISRAQGGLDFTLAGWKTAKLALALRKDQLFYNHISELTFELNRTTEKMPSKDQDYMQRQSLISDYITTF